MKRLSILFCTVIGICCTFSSFAIIHPVQVSNMQFTPNIFNASQGDTVVWVLVSGSHTTTSTTIPAGAATWDKALTIPGDTFAYVIPNISGTYNYKCTPHGFTGNFIVTSLCDSLALNLTKTDAACYNSATGLIDLTVTGGSSVYGYMWSNSATTEDIDSLAAGTYSVTVLDINTGCQKTGSSVITQPNQLSIFQSIVTNVACNGDSTGVVILLVIGGKTPYSYLWSNGTTTANNTGLAAGIYTVTITDANNCTITGTNTVTEPALLSATVAGTDVTCFGGNDGAAGLTVNDGSGNFAFMWSTGETTEDISGLIAGIYTVTVIDTTCSDTAIKSVTINEPTLLGATATPVNELCFGYSAGEIDLSPSGGTSPYLFSWSNGDTVEDLLSLDAGIYICTITDNNGCTATQSATVTEPAILAANGIVSDVSCNGGNDGAIDLTVSGGTAPYTFSWSDGSTTEDVSGLSAGTLLVTITDTNMCSISDSITVYEPAVVSATLDGFNISCNGGNDGAIDLTIVDGSGTFVVAWSTGDSTEDLIDLTAGIYSVTVIDAACSDTLNGSITLTEPASPLSASVIISDVLCNGGADGAADLTVSGGTPPYAFLWSNSVVTEDISNLIADTYSVTITDSNNCQLVITDTVFEPTALIFTTSSTDAQCGQSDGSATITLTGGTPSYFYNWDASAGLQTTSTATGLAFGSYTVNTNDANGCPIVTTVSVGNVGAPSLSAVLTNPVCAGIWTGAIDVTVSGGTLPFAFIWTTSDTTEDISGVSAGTYSVTVTDSNLCKTISSFTLTEPSALSVAVASADVSCNNAGDGSINLTVSGGTLPYDFAWSTTDTAEDIDSLSGGSYSYTVNDGNGCTSTQTVIVTEPAALTASSVITGITCNGGNDGAIDLTVSGGVSPYNFLWSDNSITEDVSNLTADAYMVTVSDANACTLVSSLIFLNDPPVVSVSVVTADASCFGGSDGSADLTVSNGVGPFSFSWSTSDLTEDISGLSANTYSVTVVDSTCADTVSASVSVGQATAVSTSTSVTNSSCNGADNGFINLTPSGGTTPYTFNWSNGSPAEDIGGLAPLTYYVTVTDSQGCSQTDSADVTEPAALSNSTTTNDASCFNGCDGSAAITISGGTPPYFPEWSDGQTLSTATGLCSGTYWCGFSDQNGCKDTAFNVTVGEPSAISITLTPVNESVCGAMDGSISAFVLGGIGPYSYSWNTGGATTSLSGLSAGLYTLTVTDANGCTMEANDSVNCIIGIYSADETGNDAMIFPNPSHDGFFLVDWSPENGNYSVAITNILGETIFFKDKINATEALKLSIEAKGVYFIRFKSDTKVLTRKIVFN